MDMGCLFFRYWAHPPQIMSLLGLPFCCHSLREKGASDVNVVDMTQYETTHRDREELIAQFMINL